MHGRVCDSSPAGLEDSYIKACMHNAAVSTWLSPLTPTCLGGRRFAFLPLVTLLLHLYRPMTPRRGWAEFLPGRVQFIGMSARQVRARSQHGPP